MTDTAFTWDVFVSFSGRERDRAELMVRDLQAEGLQVWYDRDEILPGDRIREAIHHGIRNSRTLLLLVSRKSLVSRWVLNELDAAMLREIDEQRKIVIPVLIGRIEADQLPADIRGKNYLDLRHNFRARYRLHARAIANAIRAAGRDHSTSSLTVPLGDDALRMILGYTAVDLDERLPENLVEQLVEQFIRTPRYFGLNRMHQRRFTGKHGRNGVAQVVRFFAAHNMPAPATAATLDDVASVVDELAAFVVLTWLREEAFERQGIQMFMRVAHRRPITYRQMFMST